MKIDIIFHGRKRRVVWCGSSSQREGQWYLVEYIVHLSLFICSGQIKVKCCSGNFPLNRELVDTVVCGSCCSSWTLRCIKSNIAPRRNILIEKSWQHINTLIQRSLSAKKTQRFLFFQTYVRRALTAQSISGHLRQYILIPSEYWSWAWHTLINPSNSWKIPHL